MIIEPKIKGFICITAHPKGCAKNIENNIKYLSGNKKLEIGKIKNVLVIGCSAGYGLASAMAASFSMGAKVIGAALEKNAQKERGRTASAGMYNLAAYKKEADKRNLDLDIIIGDAFANKTKEKVCDIVNKNKIKIDLIVYSIASPIRIDPETGVRYNSVLKPIGKEYKSKGIDLTGFKLNETLIQPASEDEIKNTIKVMGGEDLELWVDVLAENNLLSENASVVSYSYIGPPVTHDIYLNGSVGAAKKHLKQTSDNLNKKYKIKSYVSVNKALVTQASAAIPVLPLYISLLFKVMKEKNIHEGCIEQAYRLFEKFRNAEENKDFNLTDEDGFIRLDDLEMREDVQKEVADRWEKVTDGNLGELADSDGYRKDFLNLFGFGPDGADYFGEVGEDEIEIDTKRLGIIEI